MNGDKLQLRMKEVPFIGHVATGQGLRADPAKVQAIREMPPPENIAGVQRILGMVQYLSKFLPRLSDITKPLRDLTRQDAEWIWDEPKQPAFEYLKEAVSATLGMSFVTTIFERMLPFSVTLLSVALVRRYYKVGSLWRMRRAR